MYSIVSEEAGLFLAMAQGGRKIFVMGHPEYDRVTLDGEYKRDVGKGLQIDLPKNYYKDNDPENRPLLLWRAHANNLYTNWLNYYVYQSTPFDLMGTPDFGSISFDGLKNIIKKVRNLENISTGLLTFLVYRTNMVVYNRFKALKI